MAVSINGTSGVSGVDGSAGTPALQGTDTNTGISFGTDEVAINTGGTERVKVDSSGNVGIGTTSPGSHNSINRVLNIDGATGTKSGISLSEAGVNYFDIYFDGSSNAAHIDQSAGGGLVFTSGSSEAFRVDSSGRLLVGTSSTTGPNTKDAYYAYLQVQGNTAGTDGRLALVRNEDSTSVSSGESLGLITFNDRQGGYYASISALCDGTVSGSSDSPGRLVFSTTANGASSTTERMRIGNNGGIDVSAAGNADNHLRNTAGQTTASGANMFIDGTSGVLRRSTSSIKYKTDVETLQDSYADEILKCRPVWYRSTSDYDNQQWGYWGFIAEEVAQIDPRLCFFKENEDGSLEPEGVQYDRFVPHLLNLIKRQQAAIETLEAKVAALEGGAS